MLLLAGQCFLVSLQMRKYNAAIAVCRGVVRTQRDGAVVTQKRVFQPPEFAQAIAAVGISFDVVWA